MSDDKFYKDGDVVWVKLGNNWWPGEVTGIHRQPEGLLKHFKRKPYCVVKFFQEDSFEYVKNSKQIFPYNCNKKDEFTKKGLALYNGNNKFMEKFPGDVEIAERLTRRVMESDMLIINDRPDSIVKAILGQTLTRATNDYYGHDGRNNNTNTRRSGDSITKILNITPNRTNETTTSNAIFGGGGCIAANSTTPTVSSGMPANNSSAAYRCNLCNFTSLRQNVMIFHRKTHSASSNSTTTTPIAVAKITQNKELKENQSSSLITSPDKSTNKSSNEIVTKATTPLSSKATATVTPPRNIDLTTSEDTTYTPTKSLRKTRKEETSTATASPPTTSLTAVVSKAPHLPLSVADSVSAKPTISNEQTKSTVKQTPSTPKGTKKKDNTAAAAASLNKRKSLRSSPPEEVISVLDESTETTADSNRITTRTILENDNKTNSSGATEEDLKPKRNSEDIIRSWQAEWSDEEESMTTPTTPTVEIALPNLQQHLKTTAADIPQKTQTENAVKPEVASASAVTNVCTPPPIVTNRIRNIPKKDRRDIILKEFPPHELNTSNSQSSASPVVVTIVDSGSSSNSNSSESVVVIDEPPIEVAATVEILDVIDVDAVVVEPTKAPTPTTSVLEEIILQPTTEPEPEPEPDPESESDAVTVAHPPTTMPTWSCFDFQEDDEDNDSDVLTSIAKFKKKHLSPDKNSQTENPTIPATAIKKSDEDLELKDKQLSADIESLLCQTKSTVVDITAAATKEDVPVKALPIKERGKRIFKSRNRSRIEEHPNVGATTTAMPNSNENIPVEVATEEANIINDSILIEEDIQTEINKQTTELNTEDQLLTVDGNDKIVAENENIKVLEENNSKELDAVDINLKPNVTLAEKAANVEEVNKFPSEKPSEGIEDEETVVMRVSEIDSKVEKEIETAQVQHEPENIDIQFDDKNVFDDEVIPVIKHAPVEIFKEESTTAATDNNVTKAEVAPPQVNERENEKELEATDEKEQLNENADENIDRPTISSPKAAEINEIKILPDGEEREQSLALLPLQVNTNTELENDATSRFTSPTDENSSIGISEAGAEFGSPTSMLDDERMPIVASDLMTGIERLTHNANLEEAEVEAGANDESNNIEQTNIATKEQKQKLTDETDEANITKHSNEKNEESLKTVDKNKDEEQSLMSVVPNENNDLLKEQPSLQTDELAIKQQKTVQSLEEAATTEDDEIESPPHEKLLSGSELEEELKILKTIKKVKTRKKTSTNSKSHNLNNDGDTNNKIKKEEHEQKKKEEEKEHIETHKPQGRTTRQSVQKLALEVTATKKENKKPQMLEKINKNENTNANIKVQESENISSPKASKEKTKKKENNTTVIGNNDEQQKNVDVEIKSENKVETKNSTEPTKRIDGEEEKNAEASTISEISVDKDSFNDIDKATENVAINKEEVAVTETTATIESSEISTKSHKTDLIEELDLLINLTEVSENKQPLEETEETLEKLIESKDSEETERKLVEDNDIKTETKNVTEAESKEIKIENNKETMTTRKRRSHIKITPRKRSSETSLTTETTPTTLNTKAESKSSQTEAKMRKKSDEIETKTLNLTAPAAQASTETTIPADTVPATAVVEVKIDEVQNDVVAVVEKENEVVLENVAVVVDTNATASNTTSTTTPNTLSEMRSFRPRRKTNHFETTNVLTTTTTPAAADDTSLKCENDKTTNVVEDQQSATTSITSHELESTNIEEKAALPAVEKVRINVDVANPLSSQIANILATSSAAQQQNALNNKKHGNMSTFPATTTVSKTTPLTAPLKRKKSIEDDIPSFIIERPCAATAAASSPATTTVANAAAEKEAFAHVQNKCPQVKITRKEKMIETELLGATNSVKVAAAQSLQSPTQMFILNPTTGKHRQSGETAPAMFDIGNMPILLTNEQLIGTSSTDGVHIVITPTAGIEGANLIESIVTDAGDGQLLSPTATSNQTSILMHVVPTNAAKSPNDGPRIIQQQILQVAHTQSEQLQQQQHEQNQQLNIKTRKPTTNTRSKRLPSRQQQQQQVLQQQQLLQQQIHETTETEDDRKKKLKIEQQSLTPHQKQLQEQQRVLQLQKQQHQNAASQTTSNKQIGIDTRGNKYVIIKTNQPPADLVVPQQQQQAQQALLQQNISSKNAAAATSFNFGTETAIEAFTESPELLQQPKQKSPAAAATGGRKQAGNIITLPSNAAAVKQQQQQFTESIQIAAEATSNMLSSSSSSQSVVQQKATNTNSKNHSNLTAASNKRTKASQLSQQQLVQQQEIVGNKKTLPTKDKKQIGKSSGNSNIAGNRRLSAIESPLPTKIPKTSMNNTFTGDVVVAQQQQQQLQTTSQPPPLHPLQNRKVKKQQQQQQQQQQQNRLSTANANKKETTNITETNELLRAISQQQQQQQQQQQPSTSSLSQQQQQSVHSTTISEEQLMQDQNDGTSKILAVPTQPIPGYNETFLLCTLDNNSYKPIDNVPLYLDHDLNQLVPVPLEALDGLPNLIVNHPPPELQTSQASSQQQKQNQQLQQHSSSSATTSSGRRSSSLGSAPSTTLNSVEADSSTQMISLQSSAELNEHAGGITEVVPSILEPITHSSAGVINDDSDEAQMAVYIPPECNAELPTDNAVILNIEGQQIILDAATFAHLLANPDANTQLITDDGTEFVLTREVLAALEAQQDSQDEAAAAEQHQRLQQQLQQQAEAGPTDILAVALAGSDLYGNEVLEIETSQGLQLVGADGIVFQSAALPHQHLTPPITAQTSETNALLNQTPIMSTLEKPSTSGKRKPTDNVAANLFAAAVSVADLTHACRPNLEDSLAVIGVTTSSSSVPTSLELPITVTNPAIAPKSTMAGPTAPVGLSSTSSVVVTESVQFQCLPHRTGGMAAGETRIYNDPGS